MKTRGMVLTHKGENVHQLILFTQNFHNLNSFNGKSLLRKMKPKGIKSVKILNKF